MEAQRDAPDPVRTHERGILCARCGHRFPIGQDHHSKDACRAVRWRREHPSVGPRQTDLFGLREGKKRHSKASKMLELLKRGPVQTWDLMRVGGAGFSSRLREIRTGQVDGVKHTVSVEQHEDFAIYRLEE